MCLQGTVDNNTFMGTGTKVLVFRTECTGSVTANNPGLTAALTHVDTGASSGSASSGGGSTPSYGDYSG